MRETKDWEDARRAGADVLRIADAANANFQNRRTLAEDAHQKSDWRKTLELTESKKPRAIIVNAVTALNFAHEWQGVLGHDAFALKTVALRPPPWIRGQNSFEPRDWTPQDDNLAACWLQKNQICVGTEVAQQAIETVANENKFHPVRDYLSGLRWDGKKRVQDFGARYLGVTQGHYVQEVSKRFLLSAVARILKPGCQADHVLIIEGRQGIGKSSCLQALAQPWFTDELADFGSKDAAMQLRSAWVIEIAELDSINRSEASRIKAFISRKTDRFRPPYGRRIIEAPRQCVFAGTTNSDTYLKDETGARRFWPVKAVRIDIDAIHADRDQLWAEAVVLFHAGEKWWFDERTGKLAEDEQTSRNVDHPWREHIDDYLEGRENTSVADILKDCIGKDKDRWTQTDQNIVAGCLKGLGWERRQRRVPGSKKRDYRYYPIVAG